MKKALALIGRILLTVLTTVVFLFSVGTVWPRLPIIGSVANIVTVGYLHIWLPLCVALFLLSLVCFFARKKKGWFVLVCSAVSLICTIIFVTANASTLKQYGVKPNVFLSKEDVSSVSVETRPYMESEYSQLALNVYRLDDGEAGKPVMIYIHGGGWIQGSKEDHTYYSKVFANHG